ncbi:di-N-acetylchitobiase-like isoform X2 [Penaeus japonicus]|uniref:di-N-acetylchitobiase-like isoform X2 n=1 Tax=Penaeus japonicus TaxID=27405 RepID=UPI001C7131AE|nr:di-N-acetylchitobiase-like isoform X2 [Penaeus japonicus]
MWYSTSHFTLETISNELVHVCCFQKTRMDCVVKILCAIILATLTDISLGSLISQKHFIPSPALHPSPKSNQTCPCNQDQLCLPLAQAKEKYPSAPHVQEYIKKSSKKEVFAFVLKCDASVWSKFDWTKLTTIAIAGFYDPHLVCFAHQHGVKVVKLGNFPTSNLPNATARANWVNLQASDTALKFLDGINIDYEDAIEPNTPEQKGLTSLVQETASVFHSVLPGSQVSFDVAWSADGIDGRFYEYKAIANYSDLIFIMAYDEQSQILEGPCTARPNSGIYKTAQGIESYLNLGIPPQKMILGVPWYGYNYPCLNLDKNGTCFIKEVPFRGVNCSDAAGKEYPYSYMISTRETNHAQYHWDKNSLTPWFNIKDNTTGQYRQMRYDDERSLTYKYMLAIMNGMSGVGMWTANFLDYSDTEAAAIQQRAMWSLLP